ncbi:hypothetical protein OQA88_11550 [Cercophora sp. LCS_1]
MANIYARANTVLVLQEIALAKRAILMCGDVSVPWDAFAGRKAVESCTDLQPDHLSSSPGSMLTLQAFSQAHGNYLTALPPTIGFRNPTVRDVGQLLPLRDIFSFCAASDPRGKVFALYGLVTGLEPSGLTPDYSDTVGDVFVDIAVFIAATCGSMALLSRAVCRRSVSRRRPWLPDWRQPQAHIPPEHYVKIVDAIRATSPGSIKPSPVRRGALRVKFLPVCSLAQLLQFEARFQMAIFPADDTDMITIHAFKEKPWVICYQGN